MWVCAQASGGRSTGVMTQQSHATGPSTQGLRPPTPIAPAHASSPCQMLWVVGASL